MRRDSYATPAASGRATDRESMMQMLRDSLVPEALGKFLREEAMRPSDPMIVERAFTMGEQEKAVDPAVERAKHLQAELSAKLDRGAEDADRAAFAKRKAMEAAR